MDSENCLGLKDLALASKVCPHCTSPKHSSSTIYSCRYLTASWYGSAKMY